MSYSRKGIASIHILETSKKLAEEKLISVEQLSGIITGFKIPFYSPSFFVRVGLFIFTLILVNSALGIVALTISDAINDETTIGILLLIAGGITIGILEYFINTKNHFRSGIDDCLLYYAIFLMVVGCMLLFHFYDALPVCCVFLPFAILAAGRYADSFNTILAYVCFLTIVFLILKDYESGRLYMPFIMAAISSVFIFISRRLLKNDDLYYYENCLSVLRVASLLTFYLSVNYFVVKEGNRMLNDIPRELMPEIPLAIVFLGLTVALPLVYIILGIKKYDKLLLWTGLAILILTVLTIRYRFHILPYEYTLIISGLILLPGSWFVIKFLQKNNLRYTFKPDSDSRAQKLLNAEALLISQTMGQTTAPETSEGFGGGSFGGGGAGGTI